MIRKTARRRAAAIALLIAALHGTARGAVVTASLAHVPGAPAPIILAASSFAVPSLALAAPLQTALMTAGTPRFSGLDASEPVQALVAADLKKPDARRAFTPVLQRLAAGGADTPAKIAATAPDALHMAVLQANGDVQGRLRELSRRIFDGSGGFSAVSRDLGELRDIKAYGSPYLNNSGFNTVMAMALEEGPKNVIKLRHARKDGVRRRLSETLGLTLDPKLGEDAKEKIAASLAHARPLHAERIVLHNLRGERGGVIRLDMPPGAASKDQVRMLIGRPGRMVPVPILSYDTYNGGSRTVVVTEYGTLTVGDETGPRWNDESLVATKLD